MARRSKRRDDTLALAEELAQLLDGFRKRFDDCDLRARVQSLVPAFHKLRDVGSSLIPFTDANSARERIIWYLKKYPKLVIDGDELMVISGIGEWARRVRELRVQFGWWIYSGVTLQEMAEDSPEEATLLMSELDIEGTTLRPDQYVLFREDEDRDAAHRWHIINSIRKKKASVQSKLLEYFSANVGKEISGEELRYLANERTEWPRRTRELRTEEGWPIATKMSGRVDLPVGVYVLEENRQAEPHDRKISDPIRVAVLKRDNFSCAVCGWNRSQLAPGDPRRFLELHHKKFHRDKGQNTEENLVTLCNVHHDEVHRKHKE